MGYEYDAAISVESVGPGEYAVDLDPGWVVGGGVNGGYALSVIGNAIRAEYADAGHADPYTVTGYYVSPTQPGPGRVRLRTIRSGRGTSTMAASLVQEQDGVEAERISVLATYGNLAGLGGEVRTVARPPVLPPIEDCLLTSDAPAEFKQIVPMLDRFAMRMDPATAGWVTGQHSGNNFLQAWFELADGRPIDPIALLMVVDTLPPVTFELGLPGWAPTLELTVHVRGTPAAGPLRVRHETRNFAGGFFEEDCEVWDSADRLVAQSRQLALQPRGA